MSQSTARDDLIELRRDLHRHPEPAWREFYTTARIVTALRERGFPAPGEGPAETPGGDRLELLAGREAIEPDARMAVPSEDVLDQWLERAEAVGADPAVLSRLGAATPA